MFVSIAVRSIESFMMRVKSYGVFFIAVALPAGKATAPVDGVPKKQGLNRCLEAMIRLKSGKTVRVLGVISWFFGGESEGVKTVDKWNWKNGGNMVLFL